MAFTAIDATFSTGNQTVGVKLDIDDAIRILTPTDVPLQQVLATDTTFSTKVEWLDEELLPQTFIWTSKTGTGPWTVTTSTGTAHLRVGDVYAIQDGTDSAVQFLVDSITDANVAVLSGFAGNVTSATNLDTLQLIAQYRSEGTDPLEPRSQDRDTFYNYTQIDQEQVSATRTARVRGQRAGLYGQADPYDHEVMRKFKELSIRRERYLIHGQRATTGTKRSMGGFFYYITTNTTSGLKADIKTLLNGAIRKNYNAGGSGSYYLAVSPAIKSLISTIDDGSVQVSRTDSGSGKVIDYFKSDFGDVRIVPNRHLPKTKALVLDAAENTLINFTPTFHEVLAKTGDADKGHIVAEKSLKVKNQKAQGTLTVTDVT